MGLTEYGYRTVAHEAAHAVVARMLGWSLSTIEWDGHGGGATFVGARPELRGLPYLHAFEGAVIKAAGMLRDPGDGKNLASLTDAHGIDQLGRMLNDDVDLPRWRDGVSSQAQRLMGSEAFRAASFELERYVMSHSVTPGQVAEAIIDHAIETLDVPEIEVLRPQSAGLSDEQLRARIAQLEEESR